MSLLKTFILSIVILGALDFVWLGFVMRDFNVRQLQGLARIEDGKISPLKAPAALTYVVMTIALVAFGAPHAFSGSWTSALGFGALLGFCIYGIFDLTNLAILKDYPAPFAIADMCWGGVSYGIANLGLFFARDWLTS